MQGDKGDAHNSLPKSISLKMNIVAWLKFEQTKMSN